VKTVEADVAIVGSGVCGLLSAWPALLAGQRVTMLERGALKTHAEQLADGQWAADVPGAEPNDETAPGTPPYPWSYVYGVGGSSLHWDGATPRFTAADFRMRSAYGVMVDWPLTLAELEPYYVRAEQALGVSGAPEGAGATADGGVPPGARILPAHPLSPMDRAVAPHLHPLGPLPQARPSQPLQGRPACCGSATCELCPVDARFSALNGLRGVLDHPRLDLRRQTVAARLRTGGAGRQIEAIEAIDQSGERFLVRARRYVLAANGFENPGILLRSGLRGPAVGRYLFDHAHTTLIVDLRRDLSPGHGDTLSTGLSEALREGGFRAKRSGAILIPFNPGAPLAPLVTEGVLGGGGDRARSEALSTWNRRLPLDMLTEDVPQAGRRVTLASKRDSFGLPLNLVAYPRSTSYELDGIEAAAEQVRRRLAPLGARSVEVNPGPRGGHLLGTCRMGTGDDAVVDPDMRHLEIENLFVAGGSAFPTYSAAHPTLTIAALALRLGDLLTSEVSSKPAASPAVHADL
jgi:glucose dehydrogenase